MRTLYSMILVSRFINPSYRARHHTRSLISQYKQRDVPFATCYNRLKFSVFSSRKLFTSFENSSAYCHKNPCPESG